MDSNITPKVREMWHVLRPLFAHGTPHDPAWNDLNRIWREATRIGILMLSKPCIYTLDFPPMGPNSYFNPSNMCNRDEGFTQNPQALSSIAVSVRLAITPIITETDFMKDAKTTAANIGRYNGGPWRECFGADSRWLPVRRCGNEGRRGLDRTWGVGAIPWSVRRLLQPRLRRLLT